MKQDHHQQLYPDKTYHLFSRAIGNERLFISNDNYYFFLNKMKFYITAVADVYCYSLLPNHFHLLVRIKSRSHLLAAYNLHKQKEFNEECHNLPDFVMERFSNFLNSYTKSFNKVNNRKGALFLDYLKRTEATDDSAISAFIFYIHKNAVHHGLTKSIGAWKFDSYWSFIREGKTLLLREEIIQWFGGVEGFIEFHNQKVELKIQMLDVN